MATTYELIASVTLTGTAGDITFTSIPATYDDLLVALSPRSDRSARRESIRLRVNGAANDTNHSTRTLYGDGSSAVSTTFSNIEVATASAASSTANTFSNIELYIPNYAGSTAKSMSVSGVQEDNYSEATISASACLWNDTAAITSLKFELLAGNDFVAGTTAYLYGITKA